MARTESRAMSLIRALNVAPPGVAGPRVGLVASEPADGAAQAPPAAIGLLFSGAVRLTAFAVTDGGGARVDDGFTIGLIPATGLVGAPLILASATGTIFGAWDLHDPSRGALPIAVWEFSLGVYL